MGIAIPSAEDNVVNYVDGTPLLRVANQSLRIQTLRRSAVHSFSDFFVQSFAQLDTPANGNTVSINSDGSGLAEVGKLNDSTNLYLDLGVGYWLYRSNASRGLTGVIPMVELYQNTSLQDGDMLSADLFKLATTLVPRASLPSRWEHFGIRSTH